MDPEYFFSQLLNHQINFYAGVPDSTLQPMINFLNTDFQSRSDIIHNRAVNECEAIALASGYHLGTHKIGMVYMQNSGLGKSVNPLTSLADKEVFSIPILLMIGWRGVPGKSDDPQHMKMGRIMESLLRDLEIPFTILEDDDSNFDAALQTAVDYMHTESSPYALICKSGFFSDFMDSAENEYHASLTSTHVISKVLDHIDHNEVLISTTGRLSRALAHLRHQRNDPSQDFFTLGSMGCASAIGLGVAQTTTKSVIVFDGDGAALMQMGTLASIGHLAPKNYFHIIIDNNGYCSTGCQPSISDTVDYCHIAQGCGYKYTVTVSSEEEFDAVLPEFLQKEGPVLMVAKVKRSRKKYLQRLQDPLKYKRDFMAYLQDSDNKR